MGIQSVIPPIIVVAVAILSRDILISLVIGIICGLGIYGVSNCHAIGIKGILDTAIVGFNMMAESVAVPENMLLIIFLCILGGVIAILAASGCSKSFAESATKYIKTKRAAEGCTFLLGCLIFIDDYFNAITVGNVMVSITDKFKVSRAKLAYIIDSTSAPVTILMPISSWVATILSLMVPQLAKYGMAESGMRIFLSSTIFNYYAWLTLLMVISVIIFDCNIGSMRKYENNLLRGGEDTTIHVDVNEDEVDSWVDKKKRGSALDLVFVLVMLVILTIAVMLYTGGAFSGEKISDAFLNCDANISLTVASFITLLLCFAIFVLTRKMSLKTFSSAFIQGVKSMVYSLCILVLSWTFSELLGSEGLMTGEYLAAAFSGWLQGWMLPIAIFAISAIISFSTGASWGAMSIMIPTSIAICASIDKSLIHLVLGATLAGSVFGDHCSPVADTTVLSSSGAGCKHLDHVSSQLPYAIVTAIICTICYLIAGFLDSKIIPLIIGGILVIAFTFIAKSKPKNV